MRKVHRDLPVLFEPHGFQIVEHKFEGDRNKVNESIFNVANGYIGLRGFFEEGTNAESDRTTMLNGVYEYFDYHHIWQRPGFPGKYHAIVGQADPVDVQVFLDGERASAENSQEYSRTLDMRDDTLVRKFVYTTQSGKSAELVFTRFAHQREKHLLVTSVQVNCRSAMSVRIVSTLSMPAGSTTGKAEIGSSSGKIYEAGTAHARGGTRSVTYSTLRSGFKIVCAVAERANAARKNTLRKESASATYSAALGEGESVRLDRFIVYGTDREFDPLRETAEQMAETFAERGYDALYDGNVSAWREFWKDSDVCIDGDELIQQGIRYGIFNIYQSVGRDGITNISANGLTGTAYSGHYFWDTEIFMEPMLLYTHPELTKKLIEYRYNILDKARERAREMEHPGALYAWNSTNGEECGHVFEAVTAQYHINADVGYSIYKYYEATQDEEFLFDKCAEILLETSMCLSHRGNFIERKGGKFCLNVVCGPDEYNPIVDNNLYTNMLTRLLFKFTLETMEKLRSKRPAQYEALVKKCHYSDGEFARLRRAADNMYLAWDEENEMYMQDDNFLSKDPIDIESIPPEKLPLLVTLHPLNLWRYKVCKQADIVLLTFLRHEEFTPEMRKKIFDTYEPLTIHDSSLSSSIHSIVACDIGYYGEAYGYLKQAARMDLDNVNKNTYFGLHAACMGACWMMLVNGYAGLRIYDGKMHFKPYCDEKWKRYTFRLKFRGSALEIGVTPQETVYRLTAGAPLTIEHCGECFVLENERVMENKQ